MRNPLSAIMLCADGIANSLIEFSSLNDKSTLLSRELVERYVYFRSVFAPNATFYKHSDI